MREGIALVRIIIADDHRIMREGVRMLLADYEGIEVVGEADNGESLLQILETVEVDAVLMDLEMPGIGGLDALTHLDARFPDVAVVILSMHDRPDFVRQAITRGAGGYLLKSASREEVIRALETVVAGGSYVQQELVAPLVAGIGEEAVEPSKFRLTNRELQVLELIALGRDTQAMAADMGVAEATVRTHVKNLFARLGVHSRAEAVAVSLREGLIS
jgi:NarL family two-component system response regulator YdfI